MTGNLRSLVMRGGAYMSLRQALGLGLGFGGMILLTRAIGPANFGLYSVALGILTFTQNIAQGGIRAYLVRREGEVSEEIYDQAFTLMLLIGAGVTALICLGLPLLEGWVRVEGFGTIALVLFLSLPLILLTKIPMARLERALDFRRVAMIELLGMTTFYLVALGLAFNGFGVIAPVAGWWAQQLALMGLVFGATRYLPRPHWDRALAKNMVGYGLSFTASNLAYQMRELVNPMIVARYLGAEAAGYVALAIRLVRGLTFMKETAWRLSMPALARLQHDRSRLIRAVTEGMQLQLLVLAPPLVLFGWAATTLIPLAFGEQWLPVTEVYPFIALGTLVNALFTMHSSALYALRRNVLVAIFNSVHIALFAGSAFLLVPQVGLVGYGLAEIVALAGYAVIHESFVGVVGRPAYLLTGVWGVAAALALFAPEVGWWAAAGVAIALVWPRTWRELSGYARAMWKARVA